LKTDIATYDAVTGDFSCSEIAYSAGPPDDQPH